VTADEFLLELYKEEQTHARHTEVQRLEVTKFILVAVGVLVGFMATLKFSIYCLPFGLLTVALGFIGLKVTSTYVQRFDDHRNRARAFRSEIDEMVLPAHRAHQILKDHVLDKSDRLRMFWQKLNKGVIVLGIVCLLCNLLAIAARGYRDPAAVSAIQKILNQLSL
jgi:hypothetical protein